MKKFITFVVLVVFSSVLLLSMNSYAEESVWKKFQDAAGIYEKVYKVKTKHGTSCTVSVKKNSDMELNAKEFSQDGKIILNNDVNVFLNEDVKNFTDVIGQDGTFLYTEDSRWVFIEECVPILNKEVPNKIRKRIKEALDV